MIWCCAGWSTILGSKPEWFWLETPVTPLPPLKLGNHGHESTDTSRVLLTHTITHSAMTPRFLCISPSHLCGDAPDPRTRNTDPPLTPQPAVASSLNREVGAQGATQSCLLLPATTAGKSAHPGVTPHIPRWSFHIPDSPSARNSSVNKDSQNHSFPRWVKLWDYSPTRHVFTEMVIENPLRHNNPKMTAKIIFLFCTSLISFCLDTNKSIATAVMLPFSDNCPCSSTTLSASFIFSSNPCKALHSKVFVLSRFTRKNTGSGSLGNLFNSTVRVSNRQTQTQLYLSSHRVR